LAPQHDKPGKTRAKAKPVTAHPLFPAVVALWFGALFGLGSLAIRVGLLEAVVLTSRIDTVLPAAAPPLGVSARILLALVLAALGALIGATIARRIARPKPEVRERKRNPVGSSAAPVSVRARDSHPDAPARKPISAHEELGSEPALAGRRRGMLAIEHEQAFELHEFAPLPGGVLQIDSAPAADATLDLGNFAGPPASAEGEYAPFAPVEASSNDRPLASDDADVSGSGSSGEAAVSGSAAKPALDFAPPADAVEGRQVFGMAQRQPDEVLDQLGITDAEYDDLPPVEFPAASAPVEAAAPVLPAQSDEPALPGEKPGMIELAEKLAQSMQRRRERAAQTKAKAESDAVASAAASVPIEACAAAPSETAEPRPALATVDFSAPLPVDFDPASIAGEPGGGFAHPNDIPAPQVPGALAIAPGEANATVPAPFAAMPAALRPVAIDDESDESDSLASLLPPRRISLPNVPSLAPSASLVDSEPADEAVPEDSFSSLLDVNQPGPLRQNFIRIEEPESASVAIEPVVIFPGQAARPVVAEPVGSGGVDEANTFRRFDAPANAEAGQAVAASTAPAHDAEEAERALRAALANLQRMSGAA
jgi:hypothetical protein